MRAIERNKFLVNVKAHLPDQPEIARIIELCVLYPSIKSWKEWYDSYGNFLSISKHPKIKLFHNYEVTFSTDVYVRAPLNSVLQISKKALIVSEALTTIWLLGYDGRLRCFEWHEEGSIQISPLLVGLDRLKWVVNRFDGKHDSFSNQEILWYSGLPFSESMLAEISQTSPKLVEQLKKVKYL